MTNFVPTPTVPAPDIVRCAYMELVVTDLAKSREFYVDLLGLHVTEEDENTIYLRSLEEFIHHNLVLRKGPVAAVGRLRLPGEVPRRGGRRRGLLQGTGLPHRAPQGRLHQGHRRLRPRRGPAGLPLRILLRDRARRAPHPALRPLLRRRTGPAGPLQPGHPGRPARPEVPRGPGLPRLRGHQGLRRRHVRRVDAPQADRARHRPDRRQRPAHAPHCLRHAREAQHHPDLRQDGRPAHLATGSNAAPAGTASPTPSTSTSWTRTATASRSTPRTTTPATRTTPPSPGTSTTTSAATGGATPWSPPGTPRPPWSWTSTATRSPSSSARKRARWP